MGDQIRHGIDLARAAWGRRKWLAIFVFLLPLAALLGSVPFLPDIYKASAVVLVERQQVPEEFVRSTVTSGLETRLRTISQEILSRSRLEALIDRFDLYPDLRHRVPPAVAVERLRRDIEVEFKGVDAQLRGGAIVAFKIGYVGSDPRIVAKVANTLAGYFLEENTRVREREAPEPPPSCAASSVTSSNGSPRRSSAGACSRAGTSARRPSTWSRTSPSWSASTPSYA